MSGSFLHQPRLRSSQRHSRSQQALAATLGVGSASLALYMRYYHAMATIQVRDIPEDVAETYRRRAQASGKSLQSYMREHLIAMARRRDKAEVMAIMEQTLDRDPASGLSDDTIRSGLRDLRGE